MYERSNAIEKTGARERERERERENKKILEESKERER